MKKIIGFTLLSMLSTASFAKTCVVASSGQNPNDFNNTIATYTDIEERENMIITIIKKDGEVMTDVNLETYFQGANSQDEIDARTAELDGSKVAIIAPDRAENQLTLSIGEGVDDPDELLKSSSMSLSDLSSSKSAVFDMGQKLAIYCVD